jgi:hypothetical protein
MMKAKTRLMSSMGHSKYTDVIINLLGSNPSVDQVKALAVQSGFIEEWLVLKPVATAKAASGLRQALLPFDRPAPQVAPETAALVAVEAPQPRLPVAQEVVPSQAALAKAASPAGPPLLSEPAAPAGSQAAPALSAPGPAAQGSGSEEFPPDVIRQAMAFWLQRIPSAEVVLPAAEVVLPAAPRDEVVLPAAPRDVAQPVLDAPVVAEAPQVSPPGDSATVLICAVCQSAMGSTSQYGESEALACAHVYHSTCLDQYCSATGKTRANCCPFKCNASAYITVEIPAAAVVADGSSGSAARLDDNALQMAEEARSRALQMIE